MTAIAFRDGILATDSGVFDENRVILGYCNKITDLGQGWYCATAGDWTPGRRVEKMLAKNLKFGMKGEPDFTPENISKEEWEACGDSECAGMIVGPKPGQWWAFDLAFAGCEPAIPGQKYHAEGVCSPFLLGALSTGVTAREAIEKAIEHHALARGPINVVVCWPGHERG